MKLKQSLIAALLLLLAVSPTAFGKDKKKGERGMLESMQSVPCGSKERGVTGVGSVFASVGVAHVNSNEKLCAQYLLRSDEMDYHIRPLDPKHSGVLPVGKEAEFRIEKNRLFLRVASDDKKKAEPYEIVAMQPTSGGNSTEGSNYHPPDNPPNAQSPNPSAQAPANPAPNPNTPATPTTSQNPGVANVAAPQSDHPQR